MDFKKLDQDILRDAADAVSTVFRVERSILHAKSGTRLEMHVRGALFMLLFDQRYSREQISRETGVTAVTIWHWVNRWSQYLKSDDRSLRLYLQAQALFMKLSARTTQRKVKAKLSEIRAKKNPAF